jgi:hypothetical protein
MAYDETLAERIRETLAGERGVHEIKMMGGLCFMVDGHMALGIVGEDLMVRVGPERYERALGRAHAREMNFTGRSSKGFVFRSARRDKNETNFGVVGRAGGHVREESAPEKSEASSRTRERQVSNRAQMDWATLEANGPAKHRNQVLVPAST